MDGQRRVRLGHGAANGGFPGNSVRTSKYNIVTFLPIFLFTMFSRVAYLYFAAQARPPDVAAALGASCTLPAVCGPVQTAPRTRCSLHLHLWRVASPLPRRPAPRAPSTP